MRSSDHLLTIDSIDEYAATLHRGVDHLARHLAGLERPFSGVTPAGSAAKVGPVDLDGPTLDAGAALAELSEVYLDDAVYFHDPRYAAHLNCPVAVPALLAELFVSGVNSSLDTWDQSAGGTLIERKLVDWTCRRIGFGAESDGIFTSGGTQSNLQALLLARGQACLQEDDPTAPLSETLARLRVFATAESHFSVQKAASVMGLGAEAVVLVPTDHLHRMDPFALAEAIAHAQGHGLIPMAVVATAGTTDLGAIDPVDRIADVCKAHQTWLHVDAAFGGGLLASTRRRHLLAGIEHADSVTIDFHKTWFQPVSSSAVLVRDAETMRHVTWHADYLNPKAAQLPNQVDKSMQTTRRFDALKLWMTLRMTGADAIGDMFDTTIDLARELFWVLTDEEWAADFEVAMQPTLSTVVFRFRPVEVAPDAASALNTRIRRELFAGGEGIVASTTFHGETWLKLTLLNPTATVGGLCDLLDLVRTTGHRILDGSEVAR
ncbi:aspartate aminotransferase family protein [Aeromicrobium sp. Leaf350]|uniref:pyridoxal phosphate-dependent decarboxylase family protein n=1 Tax=Aeromicrobium sp. Leaf350 TaxID=2876565 RepID=UPI001E32A91F|nr:aspartate aminotransferase family protein [Aeromicrobium sp. Leaf350]